MSARGPIQSSFVRSCRRAFWTATASWLESAIRRRCSSSRNGRRPTAVNPERSDHFVLNDERDEQRPPDADLGDSRREPGESRITAGILDRDEPAAAKRAQRQLEEPLGDFNMRPLELQPRQRVRSAAPPRAGRRPTSPLPVSSTTRSTAVSSVWARESCAIAWPTTAISVAGAAQLVLDERRAPGSAQGHRGTSSEGREARLVRCHWLAFVDELQSSDRRLSQKKDNDVIGSLGGAVVSPLDRILDEPDCFLEVRKVSAPGHGLRGT